MSSEIFVKELRAQIASGVRVVIVPTHEEPRLRALVTENFGADRVGTWSSTQGLDGDEALCEPQLAIRCADESPTDKIWMFFDLHPFLENPRVIRSLRDFCERRRGTRSAIIISSPIERVPVEIERSVSVLPLPLPDSTELDSLLESELANGAGEWLTDRAPFIRGALGLTFDEARRAYRRALVSKNADDALARIVTQKKQAVRKGSTLELIETAVSLDEVGGLDVLKSWLKSRVLAFDAGARAFGLEEPRGMLVCGVQGCGKSLVSKTAARVFNLPLVRLDFADVFAAASPEHAMREALRVIEATAPIVLWVDEIEKGLGAGTDAAHVHVFGAFLTWLQERRSGTFVAATANEVDKLPPELARRGRFDEVFFVDLPGAKERADILALHLVKRKRDPKNFQLDALTRTVDNFSGAELEQVVASGLFRAYAQKRELTDLDLTAAAREIVPLAVLYEEKVQALRSWGKARARRASADRRTIELFNE